MSRVKHFHKKEAARILIELRKTTEDERLMDYRRQLLDKDNNMEETQNSSDFQDRLERNCWPWPYPSLAFPPYNINTIPIGYPTWTPPNAQYWFPNSPSYMPESATSPYNLPAQAFHGIDYPGNLPWPTFPYQQAYVDPTHCNRRRRTKFTNAQLEILEKAFTQGSKFPSPGERMRLETRTGLSKEKISVWFQNRRAKEKREKGHDGGSKEESTTTESELETEDERQLGACEETPEDDSEIEEAGNHHSNLGSNIKVIQHPDGLIAIDSSGLYHNDDDSTPSMVSTSVQSMTSYHDESPRKRHLGEPQGFDQKPYFMGTEVSSDVISNIDNVEDRRRCDMSETVSIDGNLYFMEPGVRSNDRMNSMNNDNDSVPEENPRERELREIASIYDKPYFMETSINSDDVKDIDSIPEEDANKRDMSEMASINYKPYFMATSISRNDVISSVKNDNDSVPNEGPKKSDTDELVNINYKPYIMATSISSGGVTSNIKKDNDSVSNETPEKQSVTNSVSDENPRKRNLCEMASNCAKPYFMATSNSNATTSDIKKNNDNDSDSFQNKKAKVEEDQLYTTIAQNSTGTQTVQYRVFGEA